jgi:hypothetical protein
MDDDCEYHGAQPSAIRRALVIRGHVPLPLDGKVSPRYGKNGAGKGLSGWQRLEGVTGEMIDTWSRTWPTAVNTGVLTRFAPALDLDILNPEAAEACEALVSTRYEGRGVVLVRIGRAPKRAILFHTTEPFPKILANITAPNGTSEKIEMLGDGQQLVVDGIHPETHAPYCWHAGTPWETHRDELPPITASEAAELVEELAELLVREFSYTRATSRGPAQRKRKGKAKAKDMADSAGSSADWADHFANVHDGNALHDSLCALAAKLVTSGTSAGAAVNQLRALLEASTAPRDDRFFERMQEIPRLVDSAIRKFAPPAEAPTQDGIKLEDFHAYLPQHAYLCAPSRDLWPGASINARFPPVGGSDGKPIPAAAWLDANAAVEQMSWVPGAPLLIKNRLVADGGWVRKPGWTVFNLYRPPALVPRPGDVSPWLDLVGKVFPDEVDHVVHWLAHRVQRPHEKINHALVLGGKPGIGKDTILEPVKQAVGPWNFTDISPKQALGRFNGFLRSVILRINEARDLGEFDRFAFYDHMKTFIATPPDVIRIDEKNLREYAIFNLTGVVITTNYKANGIYLPADDRRHFVAWSSLNKDDFAADYWRKLYGWYVGGGNEAVADYLWGRDLSGFDPKAPPPKTGAFFEIADANRAPEDAELADVLDDLGQPDAVTLDQVANRASMVQPAFAIWLRDSKANARRIPHRFEDCGYVAIRNPRDTEGRWKIDGRRHTIYGRADLTEHERYAAAFKIAGTR